MTHPPTPPAECFPWRRARLCEELAKKCAAPLEAILVSNPINVSWLTGFTGDSSLLLLGPGRTILISDFRFVTQLAEECPGLETWIRTSDVKLHEAAAKVLGEQKLHQVGYEGSHLTCEAFGQMAEATSGVQWTAVNSLIEDLRAVKDAWELQELRHAVDLADRGLKFLRSHLTPDMTEREAAAELEHAIRRFGADKLAFPAIIGVGDRGALPHYRAGALRIQDAPTVLVDWGALTLGHYHSDLTRVLVTGKPSDKFRRVYDIVLQAQLRAIAAIRPGAKCSDVDAVARGYITDAGFGKEFGHGLGHGIGMNIHEQPRFSPASKNVLEPGMVVTVEPGIYIPSEFGVRIEDDILVTADGNEVLSAIVPKDYESARLRW